MKRDPDEVMAGWAAEEAAVVADLAEPGRTIRTLKNDLAMAALIIEWAMEASETKAG